MPARDTQVHHTTLAKRCSKTLKSIVEEQATEEASPPLQIVGMINEAGLGPVSWWNAN